jgi:uncharacterized protein (TIGR02444 family)
MPLHLSLVQGESDPLASFASPIEGLCRIAVPFKLRHYQTEHRRVRTCYPAGENGCPMSNAETQAGSPFWRFSLRFYRRPDVAQACIALQDGCGVDVNLLLFLLWLAADKRRIGAAEVEALLAKAGPWRDEVVVPLRALRRRLKGGSPLLQPNAAEFFRTRIKALELEAERLQQEALFALAASLATAVEPSVERAARGNLAAYERAMGHAFTPAAVDVLLAAMSAGPADAAVAG